MPFRTIVLNDWYGPLVQGTYELAIQYRLQPQDPWRESNLSFQILPADSGLKRIDFAVSFITDISNTLVKTLALKKPGWRHERVQPITGSQNIIIDYFIAGRERVSVYIHEALSPVEATKALQAYYPDATERLKLGDEGLIRSGTRVSFRKGRLLFDVGSVGKPANAEFGYSLVVGKDFAQNLSDTLPHGKKYNETRAPGPQSITSAQVRVTLAPIGGPVAAEVVKQLKFNRGDSSASFDLVITNTTTVTASLFVRFNHEYDRPELSKSGEVISYREDIQTIIKTGKEPPPYQLDKILLLYPGEPQTTQQIKLADWYRPLEPGKYSLRNQHRINTSEPWIDCGVIEFEIVP